MTWATGVEVIRFQGIRRVEHGKHVEDPRPRVQFVTFV